MKNTYTRWELKHYMPTLLEHACIYDMRTAVGYGDHASAGVYELHYIHSGEAGWVLEDGTSMRVTGGCCSLIQPGVMHRMDYGVIAPCKLLALCIKETPPEISSPYTQKEAKAIYHVLKKSGNSVVPAGPEVDAVFCTLRKICIQFEGKKIPPLQEASLRMMTADLLIKCVESFTQHHASEHFYMTRKAKRYIEDHLERELCIGDIAAVVKMHRVLFHKIFLKETGLTPADYCMRRRLEKAQQRLRETSESITGIAHRFCFSSSQTFATSFKRYFSVTPSQYRNGRCPK